MRHRRRGIGIAAVAACLLALVVPAVFADDVNLGTTSAVTIGGPLNSYGFTLAPAGDVNGDGRPDFIVGAPNGNIGGRNFGGAAWVVFGLPGRASFNIADLGSDGFRILGTASSETATGVSSLGDINGDGKADLLVGADMVGSGKGAAYVVFGKADGADVDLATFDGTQTTGYRILGNVANERFGNSVAVLGDLNGDGRRDAIIGADFYNGTGAAYVLYSKATTSDVDLSGTGWGYLIKGAAQSDVAGGSVAGAGDFNGDGIPDALIGAYQHSFSVCCNREQIGATYVVYGRATPPAAPINLAALGTDGVEIDGAAEGDELGYEVYSAGDTNGDGKADIATAALFTDHHGITDAGTIYVIRGRAAPGTIDLASPPAGYGYAIDGANPQGRLQRVTSGDFNGDGLSDLVFLEVASGVSPLWVVPGKADNADENLATPPAGTRRLLAQNQPSWAFPIANLDGAGHAGMVVSGNGFVDVYTGGAVAATPTPTATATPAPTAPTATATPAPPVTVALTTKPPAKPKPKPLVAAKLVKLPARSCTRWSRLKFALKHPAGVTVKRATVRIGTRKAKVIKGKALKRPVTLTKLPKGRFTVTVKITATDGRTTTAKKTYPACSS